MITREQLFDDVLKVFSLQKNRDNLRTKLYKIWRHGYSEGVKDLETAKNQYYNDGYNKCLSEHTFETPCTECEDGYNRGYDDGMKATFRTLWQLKEIMEEDK